MQIVSHPRELRVALDSARNAGKRITLVPTMGNLHEGHLTLVRQAHKLADFVVVSLFVNPLQFDRADDLAAYPRTLASDADLLARENVDLLFTPTPEIIYPRGLENSTFVEVPGLSDMLCGALRPGHFRGVATIVTILLNVVRPHLAIFGEKDYQQLLIIRRLVEDLALDIEILSGQTVREVDGLAMSSRNARLTPDERQVAPALHRVLSSLASQLQSGQPMYRELEADGEKRLMEAGLKPDYVAIRRASDLGFAVSGEVELRVLAAAYLGKARLIDNLSVSIER